MAIEKKENGIEMICPNCSYSWKTKTQKYYISCPSCKYQIKLKQPPRKPLKLFETLKIEINNQNEKEKL